MQKMLKTKSHLPKVVCLSALLALNTGVACADDGMMSGFSAYAGVSQLFIGYEATKTGSLTRIQTTATAVQFGAVSQHSLGDSLDYQLRLGGLLSGDSGSITSAMPSAEVLSVSLANADVSPMYTLGETNGITLNALATVGANWGNVTRTLSTSGASEAVSMLNLHYGAGLSLATEGWQANLDWTQYHANSMLSWSNAPTTTYLSMGALGLNVVYTFD